MSIVRVEEDVQPLKYLVVTQQRDPESVITTNVVISDTRNNRINLVSIERGIQGKDGPTGPQGPAGKDGLIFDVLPINSGGTNNTTFNSGSVIYYDGTKLTSSNYSVQDILNNIGSNSNLTGIIADSGLYVNLNNNNAKIGINTGPGLTVNEQNFLVIDDTIVRKVELNLGSIEGVVPIDKGGTNNQLFNSNRLLYFDGFKIASFPLATGRILLSGTTIDIVAGSGLTGGGLTTLPSGSVVLNIGGSSDILVETNSISLSNTGTPGTYSKITTDNKGRVISGSNLTATDIINILNYTPWHSGNDGESSGLDADLLDGQHGSYYLDLANNTGIISANSLPVQSAPGLYTKVQVNNKGIVVNGQDINYGDIVNALGYRPVSVTGDTIYGSVTINGDVAINGNELIVKDNLPLLGTNSPFILPSEPRGFSFMYGGLTPQTGILAYYPGEKELRLITNIGATGILDAGSGNNFNNEVDGGNANSVYIVGNITGDMNIVLLRSVADSLYVSSTSDQTISGNKTFAQPLNVRGQIVVIPSQNQSDPPFNVGSNNRMIPNLNANLLDGKDLDYYNNAFNMTGLFDYEKVQFNNLEGSVGFIPRFDNRTNNPSRTISNSYIEQTGNLIRVTNNANFSIGSSNTGSFDANRSALVGSNNHIIGSNSLAVGSNNLVNANNSIALNSNAQALTDNSIAAGTYGYTWSNNQISFGSFKENTTINNVTSTAQGQYSTITLGLNGAQTNGSWVNLSPVVTIPKNKTLAYTLELLMNKAAGTGAALFTFESGIIKNSTFRNPNNPSVLSNITSVLKDANKHEIYNDSQKRRYYYHFNLDTNNFIQNLDVTSPNVHTLNTKVYNTESLYKYAPQYITANATYTKTNDGELNIHIPKPITYGWFYQNSGNPDIRIKSYFHGMTTGSLAQLNFLSASKHHPISRQYLVNSIIDDANFTVKETSWNGKLTNDEIILDPSMVSSIDYKNSISIYGGYLYTNSPDIYNIPPEAAQALHTGMHITFYPSNPSYAYIPPQSGKIISLTNNTLTLDTAFTGIGLNNNVINTPAVLQFNQYTKHIFDTSSIVHVNISGYGQQSLVSLSGAYPLMYCGQPTYAIKVSGLPNNIFFDNSAFVTPATPNSGTVSLISHKNIMGSYSRQSTQYKKYDGIYIRQPSINGSSTISIYNRNLEPITLPSVPFSYSLVCGYGDNDNGVFDIYKSGIHSYVKFKNSGINIFRLDNQPKHFYTNYSIGSGSLGYIFYPDQLENSDTTSLPSGFDPDVTYFPVDISLDSGLYFFNLSDSVSGSALNIIFDSGNLSYSLFPRILDPNIKDTYNIRIKTTDMSGRFFEKPFSIFVDNTENRTHIRNFIPDQYAVTGELFSFTLAQNTFPTGTDIALVATNNGSALPSWLTFNTGIQTFSGIPLSENTGNINILVKVTGENLSISDTFKLTITDGSVSSSKYIADQSLSFNINNINLSNISVAKNISYNTIVGELFTDGGYKPYCIFHTCSNSFSGRSHSGSTILTECAATSSNFSTVNLYGNIPALVSGNTISIDTYNISKTIQKIIDPISFIATINSGSNILVFNQSNDIYPSSIFFGNRIFANFENWDNNYYVTAINSTGITLNRAFTNTNQPYVTLNCYTSGYNIQLDSSINFNNNIIASFITNTNNTTFYYIDQLKYFTGVYLSDTRCPATLYKPDNIKGFDTETNEYINTTGYYSTGLVSFYTDAGYSDITITSQEDLSFENNENSIYLKFLSVDSGLLPKTQTYSTISGLSQTQFKIDNGYFFPNIQPASTGSVLINAEKNHGFKLKNNSIINQIPVQFLDTQETNSNRRPKNNLFDIINVAGNIVTVKDDQNYLLKEIGKPDYFEQPIRANYSTNGFAFNGTFVHNHDRVYDLDYGASPIWPDANILEINTVLGSPNSSFVPNARVLEFYNGFYFDGRISNSGNYIAYNGNFPAPTFPGYVMSVYSTAAFWPSTGIAIDYNGPNNTPLNVIYNSSNIISWNGQGTSNNPFNIYSLGGASNSNSCNFKIILLGYDYQNINISGLFNNISGTTYSISKISTNGSSSILSDVDSNVYANVTLYPKEIISISLSKNADQPNFQTFSLTISGTNTSSYFGNKLNLSQPVLLGSDYTEATFYIKPTLKVDQKICLNNEVRQTNNRIFFNGNQITINNFSTPRSYLNIDDQIKILNINNDDNFDSYVSRYAKIVATGNRNTSISAISVAGPKNVPANNNYNSSDIFRRNTTRNSYSFGLRHYQEFPTTGSLSFIGSVSGNCSIPYYNNIYYHTYGGFTANWPMDPYGNFVDSPKTGLYTITYNPSTCASGFMCVNIKGFENTVFNNIPDAILRSDIGKIPHIISNNETVGYVRPWGAANKRFYFDFADDAGELNGSYFINDKIDNSTITLNIAYNANYLNRSGLVYIIDSDYNVKSHINPNINNSFVLSEPSVNIVPNNNLIDSTINSYNVKSKRWKHLVHFDSNNAIYSGYNILFNNQASGQLLYLNPDKINIYNLDYSLDYGESYIALANNSGINLKDTDEGPIYLRIQTKDGSQKWSQSLLSSAPRINIYGINSYSIDTNTTSYNNQNKTWTTTAIIDNLNYLTSNRIINITASDETGKDNKNLLIQKTNTPVISMPPVTYAYVNSPIPWSVNYDIKHLPDPYLITMSGYPGPSYSIANEVFDNSNETKILYGYAGSTTGVFNTVLSVKDYITGENLTSQTGMIRILAMNETKPEYSLNPINLLDDIYLNIDNDNNSSSFYFYVEGVNLSETNLVVSLTSDSGYSKNITTEYSNTSNRFKITINLSGSSGYYSEKSISIAISQPRINSNDEIEWVRYTYTKLINITLYKNLSIDRYTLPQPLSFDQKDTWFLQFYVTGGIYSHRSDTPPSVRLNNLPNIGTYNNQPLEYNIEYNYDNIDKRWKVIATGKTDIFGNMTQSLGSKSIQIFAEDPLNTTSDSVSISFTQNRYLTNLQPIVYSIPNQAYQTTFDVKQASINDNFSINIPSQLKENTISLSRYHQQFDPDLQLHQLSYSGSPIYDKWDAAIEYSNVDSILNDNQMSSITVKCKGISSDKIYAIGKLNLIEIDSLTVGGLPIKITGLTQPYYNANEGGTWRITFKTLYGLENPNFPPTIILSGLPTVCSGYYSSLPLEQQNGCLEYRNWNPSDKSWNFAFTGFPLCGIEGLKPFAITAIDTDTIQNISLGYDTAEGIIKYTSLQENGIDHPSPQILPVGQASDVIPLTPLCNAPPINVSYRFGTRNRDVCPIATGITGWIVSSLGGNALLPSGLSYTISFPGGNPKRPWNNLASGLLTITGSPLTFASGGEYPEKLVLTVYDARNKSAQKIIRFTDTSSPNPPSPVDIAVYFDNEKPAFTPRRNPNNNSTPASGTAPIDYQVYPNIPFVYWPPANSGTLNCNSILPHNQCPITSFVYSGANFQSLDFRVFINPYRQILSPNSIVYVEFDNNPSNSFNGRYQLFYQSSQYYINIPGHNFISGIGKLVQERTTNFQTQDLQKFIGTVDTLSSQFIMGCGNFASKSSYNIQENGYGIFGRLYPSIKAIIPTGVPYVAQTQNSPPLQGLELIRLNNEYITNTENNIYSIKTSDCWQTGYLRVSGIILPAPIVELTDPAPASEAPFAYNGQQYYVGSRCVYGNNQEERNLLANKRDVNINYRLKNMLTNSVYSNSSVNSNQAIAFNHTEGIGTVFSLFISNNPSSFPTYNASAIRYAENEYFWIHKGGTKNETITQNSFPPVLIGSISNIYAISGSAVSGYSGVAVGGYVPFNEYPEAIPYYKLSNGSNWSTSDYPPFISGVVQSKISSDSFNLTYSHSGWSNQNYQYIQADLTINPYNISIGDAIRISFPDTNISSVTLILDNNNISNNTLLIPYSRPNSPPINNAQAIVSFTNKVTTIDTNSITIQHKNLPLTTGDSIDIVWSSGSSLNNISPYTDTMNIVSFDNSQVTLSYSGVAPFASGLQNNSIVDIYKNYHNQINISNIVYSKEGYWSFSLSGTPSEIYKDYRYKILTVENTGLPVFSGTSLYPKKYATSQNLFVSKPIKILLDNNHAISNNNGVWSLTFSVDGGSRPIQNYTPEVMINNKICNFTRILDPLSMKDTYDTNQDRWNITISNNNSYDWRYDTSFELKVFDDTGVDIKTIVFNNG